MAWVRVEITEIDHVMQEIVEEKRGDCMQACVASLLRIPISVVPPFFAPPGDGLPPGYEWLNHNDLWFDYAHRQEDGTYRSGRDVVGVPSGYAIASVPSARFPGGTHAVIVKDGVVVHDPSPFAAERTVPYDPVGYYYWLVHTNSE